MVGYKKFIVIIAATISIITFIFCFNGLKQGNLYGNDQVSVWGTYFLFLILGWWLIIRKIKPDQITDVEKQQPTYDITDFDTISYTHKGVPQHDEKVGFHLSNSLDKDIIKKFELNIAEASLLIYLMFERISSEKSLWLCEPEKHTDTLLEITNMLEPSMEFKKDLDDIMVRVETNKLYQSHRSWIQDHVNEIRKGQVTRIHNEVFKDKERRILIKSVPTKQSGRKGIYTLNTCIKHVSII